MLKTLLTTALGLTAAATLTVKAEGCSYRYRNYAEEPYMAELVRNARYIDLARITSVAPLLPDARQYRPNVETYEYVLVVDEALKASGLSYFAYRASAPFPPREPEECVDLERNWDGSNPVMRSCFTYDSGQFAYDRANRLAETGHERWRHFYAALPFSHNGNGGISPPEQGGGDCSWAESYEVGRTYLVFRDEAGEVLDTHGLNMQPISRADDQWLLAVRYLIDNPGESWLPAISAYDTIRKFDDVQIIEISDCAIGSDTSGGLISGSDQTGANVARLANFSHENLNCYEGQFVVLINGFSVQDVPTAYDIRDGMVDLSGIPSQHAIEPAQVPLTDVIAWLSEAPETESPQ